LSIRCLTSGPSHHGQTVNKVSPQAVAVAGDAEVADLADPSRYLLALGAAFVEVMISGAKNNPGDARQQRQIFPHDHDLGAEIHQRSNVERISGEDNEVELRCCAEQPVELRQRIVQICNDEAAHINSIRMPRD
jgi:hypothetical protein